jgi:hypothetical protein
MSWLRSPFRSGARSSAAAAAPQAAAGAPQAPAAATAPAGRAGGGVATVDFPAPQPSRAAWAALPPLHVLHGPPNLVDWHFESQLTSWQHPMFGLRPLGHLRSPDAPGGMVIVQPLSSVPAEQPPAAVADHATVPAPAAPVELAPMPLPVLPDAVPPAGQAIQLPPRPGAAAPEPAWDFPPADADPSFVASVVETPRQWPAYFPRYDLPETPVATPPAEGALRALGTTEETLGETLRPRLVPLVVTPPPAEPGAPLADLTLVTPAAPVPVPPPIAPNPFAPPAPLVPEAQEEPAARAAVEATVHEGQPAPASVAETAPVVADAAPATEQISPVLAETEPLLTSPRDVEARQTAPAADTAPDTPLDLAVRPAALLEPPAAQAPASLVFARHAGCPAAGGDDRSGAAVRGDGGRRLRRRAGRARGAASLRGVGPVDRTAGP